MINISKIVLICPRNDEEALQILKIAKKIELSVVISHQPHGAKLDREVDLIERIREKNEDADRLIIVELPGVEIEKKLREAGYDISIVDHHQYEGLNRSNNKSSLEQFLEVIKLSEAELEKFGFDVEMIKGVEIMDSEFIWGLHNRNYSQEKIDKILKYWQELTLKLGDERRQREESEALRVWIKRKEIDGILVLESEFNDISIRDAISFLVEKAYHHSRILFIKQGNRRVYLQDIDSVIAEKIHKKFGGFLFGQNKCWGILVEGDEILPTFEDIKAEMK